MAVDLPEIVDEPVEPWMRDASAVLDAWFKPIAGEDLHLVIAARRPGGSEIVDVDNIHLGDELGFSKNAARAARRHVDAGLEVLFGGAPRAREIGPAEVDDARLVACVPALWVRRRASTSGNDDHMDRPDDLVGIAYEYPTKQGEWEFVGAWLLVGAENDLEIATWAMKALASRHEGKAPMPLTALIRLPDATGRMRFGSPREVREVAGARIPPLPCRRAWLEEKSFRARLERSAPRPTPRLAPRADVSTDPAGSSAAGVQTSPRAAPLNDLNDLGARAPLDLEAVSIPVTAAGDGDNDGRGGAPIPQCAEDSDAANATRLVEARGEDLRFVRDAEAWATWDGSRWNFVGAGLDVQEMAKRVAAELHSEALQIGAETEEAAAEQKKWLKHAKYSAGGSAIKEMIKLAKSIPSIGVDSMERFDENGALLNVANGTIDLRTGNLLSHRRADLITRKVSIAFDPTAEAPRWEQFIAEIMLEDFDKIEFLRRAIGYTLTGETKEQCYFTLWGDGDNGKSTLLKVAKLLLGDLARTVAITTFLKQPFQQTRTDLAKLRGARLVMASEPNEGAQLDEALVKVVTGEDELAARKMRENEFEYRPRFKLWLLTNHLPQIHDMGHGIWRRIRLIPFEAKFAKGDPRRDPDLDEKLKAELPGILAWAVKAARDWYSKGLPEVEAIQKASDDYRNQFDLVGQFLKSDSLEAGPGFEIAASEVFSLWKRWCQVNNEREHSARWFALRLKEHGVRPSRNAKARSYVGYRSASRSADDERASEREERRYGGSS